MTEFQITNLPGVFEVRNDGNLTVNQTNNAPIVLVVGTAAQGDPTQLFQVNRATNAATAFGYSGTLTRGMYETTAAGATNVRLLRLAPQPLQLQLANGILITSTVDSQLIATEYVLNYIKSTGTLTITNLLPSGVVYQAVSGVVSVNTGAFTVVGPNGATGAGAWAAGSGNNVAQNTLLNVVNTVDGNAIFLNGHDGTDYCKMQLWEQTNNAFDILADQIFDYVVLMNMFLDDLNIQDMTPSTATSLGLTALATYPVQASSQDVLGQVFTQQYQGQNLYWWSFTGNGVAQIYPKINCGLATATTDAFGVALTAANFQEVNFAYDLANFCYDVSNYDHTCMGMIGVNDMADTTFALASVANWIGISPTISSTTGLITANGTGLLGNKFMAGRIATGSGNSLIPGFSVGGVAGAAGGGFIATSTGFINGVQQLDENGDLIDLGKYICVVSSQSIMSNPVSQSYVASGAAAYAGFVASLPVAMAPTNKIIPSVGVPFRVGLPKIDQLAGAKYTQFYLKNKGVVVADAPTAARIGSDYQRLSTNRIVKATIDACRAVADPYLGNALSGAAASALETAINAVLGKLQKAGLLQSYDMALSQTPNQAVLGQCDLDLTLIPAFELRQITIHTSLAKGSVT